MNNVYVTVVSLLSPPTWRANSQATGTVYKLHLTDILHSPTVTSPSCGRATKSPVGSRGGSGCVSADETEINIIITI